MTRIANTYVEGYCDGWAAAVMAMTDLVLAGGWSLLDAQAECMDFYRERLILTRHEDDPPEMERARLAEIDLPFSQPPCDDA